MIRTENKRHEADDRVSKKAISRFRRTLVVAGLLPALAWWSGPVAANPRGGSVVIGEVNIGSGAGRVLDIRQNSRNAIINWESFSIDAGELTRFRQPNSASSVLNRVTGGDPTAIHGALRANGNVFVINPSGILVGAGGTIDVNGLVLSTLDVNNGEFLAGGDMVMKGVGSGVTNMGRINAIGGDVFLIGRTVSNGGSVSAPNGTVGLAAGEEVLLKAGAGDERIFVRAAGAGVTGNGIYNDGSISGAAVELKAHGNMYALAINNKGAIRATGAVNSGGRVHLQGIGGRVLNSGSIRASSTSTGASARILIEAAYARVDGELRAAGSGRGGKVEIKASELAEIGGKISAASSSEVGGAVEVEASRIILESDSLIDVSGSAGGGEVLIGGSVQGADASFRNADEVKMNEGSLVFADATESGPGGKVVLWSDGVTDFEGNISAMGIGSGRGGFVEVSGRDGLLVNGTVSTLAENGAHGVLLLDPKNISISTAASSPTNINTSTLATLVVSNHVVVSTLDAGAAQAGHISVLNPVRFNSANSLTLLAEGDLYIGDDVINQGTGNINLVAGWNPAVVPLGTLLTGAATPHATLPGTATSTGGVDMDASIFNVPGAFGNASGTVYVGSLGAPNVAADRAVVVGSRAGQTNVAGYDVNVWGSSFTGGVNAGAQRYSQIGYNLVDGGTPFSSAVSGRIRVKAVNNVTVAANKYERGTIGSGGWTGTTVNTGNASYAQIGHGGDRSSIRDAQLSGEIILEAGNDLSLLGGITYNNHATLGHGGFDNADTADGTNLATLGGAISVTTGRNVSLIGGQGYHAHVQIGHGGGNHLLADFTESAITVNAGGDVTVRGGAGSLTPTGGTNSDSSRAQAQIGHGGFNADFIVGGTTATLASGKGYKGDITVTAGGMVRVVAGSHDGNNFAVIGNGGITTDGVHTGAITVTGGTGVEISGGTGASALFAQIGHFGYDSTNSLSGVVSVIAEDGGIRLTGSGSSATSVNYATIGNGGYLFRANSEIRGDTFVSSLGTGISDGIILRSGDGTYGSAHIGHHAQAGGAGPAITLAGDTDVEVAGGGLLMEASALGYFSHVMIGHGGRDLTGSKSGDISINVAAGDISVLAGGFNAVTRYNHAQIGHGGYGNGISGSDITGTGVGQGIRLVAEDGNIVIRGGQNSSSYAMVGNGGVRAGAVGTYDQFGDISLRASGDITATGGTASYTYAQIGHGGASAVSNYIWNLGGAISVEAGGNVTAAGGSGSAANSQIGHGGIATTVTSSIAASPISVKAITGDVLLLSGTVSSTGAKIGHGNYNMKLATFGESPVTVEAGRNVRLVSPQFSTYTAVSNSGTQIGHGGLSARVGPLPSNLGYSGDISVTAGGKLDVIAGKNVTSYNWSLIGHTSYFDSTGIHSGDITLKTGTVAGLNEYGVTVQGGSGDYLPFASTLTTLGGYYSFASIGHRGHSNNTALYNTSLQGDILVDVIRGGVNLLGGDGVDGSTAATTPPDIRLHGAQIGHGGFSAGHSTEGIYGSVRVHAQDDILLRSGTSRNAAVMIGHGGYSSFGPMGRAGEVLEVVSHEGSLELDSTLAINTTRGGVMIGHGAPTPGTGTRMGDILVDVAGEVSFLGTLSSIGHRTSTTGGISNADVTIRGRSFDRVTGDSGSGLFRVDTGLGAMLVANLAGGDVSLVGTGSQGIEMNAPMVWTSAFDLNLLSYKDLFIVDDLINRSTGDINVFAGWDPSMAPLATGVSDPYRGYWIRDVNADTSLFEVTGAYGNSDGSVWVGANASLAAADRAVAVGSRLGQTNVAGHDVSVWGAALTGGINAGQQRYSQIGYNRRDAGTTVNDVVTGRIRVGAVNNVDVVANKFETGVQGSNGWLSTTDNAGNASFAQIGHGGERDSVRDMQLSGGIIVEAGGDLSLLGGKAYNNHASIGHGGYDNPDDDDGNNLATLGGDIRVVVGGNVTLRAGLGYHAHVQIGHGGGNHYLADFTRSDILVDAGGDIIVSGGAGVAGVENNSRSQAQIGHGGYNADFIASSTPGIPDNVIPVSAGSGRGYKGDITVTAAGFVLVESGHHDAQNSAFIGNGGLLADGDHSGEITVTAGAGVDLRGGTGADTLLAQIGHVAYSSANAITGKVSVTARDGGIRLTGGGSTAAYATIGSGGYALLEGSTIGGATEVIAEGSGALDGIVMRSGNGSYASAHVGHLAERGVGGSVHPVTGLSGDVEVSVAGGGLLMEASAAGYFSHVMIGHGGRDVSGAKSGNVSVTVDSGDISMIAGGVNATDRYNHVQIGHGGYGNGVFGSYTGDISVEATDGSLDLLAGQSGYSYAMVGHGGSGAGDTSVLILGGAIDAKASGDITLAGGTRTNTEAQIGHGGRLYTLDSPVARSSILSSPIAVEAGGDVLVLAGSTSYTSAKIGHGGTQLKLSSFGASSVDVTAGRDIRLVSPQFETFTSASYSNTMIGHGGAYATVGDGTSGYTGDITIGAGGKIDVLASKNSGTYNWSLIGHTSYYSSNSRAIHSGDISVTSGTVAGLSNYGVTVRAAGGDFSSLPALSATGSYYSFAAIGHRGHSANTTLSGDILVDAIRGGITIEGGNGIIGTTAADTPPDIRLHGAQIGHGGYNLSSGLSGSVRVHAQSDIILRSGTARHSAVLIGHGGYLASGEMGAAGDVIEVVSREGSLELNSTAAPSNPVEGGGVYIGHGAPALSAGLRQGDILVDVAGEISFVGTLPTWIGHRSSTSGGIANADVTIRARSTDTASGDSGSGLFKVDSFLGSVLSPHLGAGHLSIVGTGDGGLEIDARIVGNSVFDLNLLSRSGVYVLDDLLNQGSGDVNVFAGWDSVVAPLHAAGDAWIRDVSADTVIGIAGAFGNGDGSVWIGANASLVGADRSVAVGSRTGQTNVAGYDINVWGSALTGAIDAGAGKYSQIGFNRADAGTPAGSAVTGRIRVAALNDLSLEANHFGVGSSTSGSVWSGVDQTGFASFAKIGHGGERETLSGSLLSGEIRIAAGGDLSAMAGGTFESYVQIGHGGHASGSVAVQASGDIGVEVKGLMSLSGGDGDRSSVLIGHGGELVGGTRAGAIDVEASGIDLVSGAGADAGVRIGHGGAGANGSSTGAIVVDSLSHLLLQGGSDSGSSSQIGHGGRQGSGTIAGTIDVDAVGISLLGGSAFATVAQIGHGGYGFGGSIDGQNIVVNSTAGLTLTGGDGKNANAQIGHGGFGASGLLFRGDISVDVAGDIGIIGGAGQFAFSQVGNMGTSLNTRMIGDISVISGGEIELTSTSGAVSAYSKIGHGHDFLAAVAAVNPVAEVAGNIVVGAFANITLTDAMIGHLNAAGVAAESGGETQIAAGMGDPTDPTAGVLLADSKSEFSGADGLRFYLAQRESNRIAPGALLNKVAFPGARVDPSDTQRYDEYVVSIAGDEVLFPNEHGNSFGTGPAPASPGNYAFYYDTITLIAGSGDFPIEVPAGGEVPGGNGGGGDGGTDVPDPVVVPEIPFDYSAYFTLDQAIEDWLRAREKVYSGFGNFEIYYENFDQYGNNGESAFDAGETN